MTFPLFRPDRSWTLFIDRDGVINRKRQDDYVKRWEEFIFIKNSLVGLHVLSQIFGPMVIVTNQRGIGRGLMSQADLTDIHARMMQEIQSAGGRIDRIYHCPHNPHDDHQACRKPLIGMALQARQDFPEIDFQRSIMLGDAWSDMEFGRNAGMFTALVSTMPIPSDKRHLVDLQVSSLYAFSQQFPQR